MQGILREWGISMSTKGNVLFSIADHPTPKISVGGIGFSLMSRDSKAPQCIVIENHPTDSRIKICEDGIFQTLSSRMGTGGNNVPMVMEDKDIQQTDTKQEGGDGMDGVSAVVRRLTPL